MREGTSGPMLTENSDGSITIVVVDYGVGFFGGGDWESTYRFDKKNAEQLFSALEEKYGGTHKEMLVAAFGETFKIPEFEMFCKEHGIEYSHTTWTS
ncbi:MAG: hypothetical protein J1G38_06710 [Clostridiales bacterium]|nr:hypothetical protein [Clostridiales bacterium]